MEKLLTIRELSEILHLSSRSIYSLLARNDIPAIRFGKALRFKPQEIEAWLSTRAARPAEIDLSDID